MKLRKNVETLFLEMSTSLRARTTSSIFYGRKKKLLKRLRNISCFFEVDFTFEKIPKHDKQDFESGQFSPSNSWNSTGRFQFTFYQNSFDSRLVFEAQFSRPIIISFFSEIAIHKLALRHAFRGNVSRATL